MAPKDAAVSSYVDNLLTRVVTGRRPAEDAARQYVNRLVAKALTQKAIEGSAREVAAACAHEAVKGYVMKAKALAKAEAEKAEKAEKKIETQDSGVEEKALAAGCARVAVARWVQAAEKAKEASKEASTNQGAEREAAASAAKIAVGEWISKATETASKEGERKVANACARVAVARFLEKAKQSIHAEGQKEQHFPEAVKRNESKAFERAVEQGDPRQVAAMCARHAVKLYLDQAKETIRRQGTEVSACSAVEQVHSTVVKAASKIAAATQPTIKNLEGMILEEEADPAVSPSGKSPMKPSGTAPKKKRPMPKESKVSPSATAWDSWTAPPSPEQFEADVQAAAKRSKHFPVRIQTNPEEERKRDVELLQKRHQENLQRVRQTQEDLRSEHNRSFLHSLVVSKELPGSNLSRPQLPPKPKPAKGRASSRRGYGKKRNESRRSSSERPRKAEKDGTLEFDTSNTLAEIEADMPRPDLDDPVLRAYLAVYKSTVCKRGDDFDACTRGAGSTCEGMPGEVCDAKRRSKSATNRHSISEKDTSWLQPGLLSWQDKAKAWFWPHKGAVPPMETAVLALLNGNPPPIEVTAKAAAAARRYFAAPAVQKMQQVNTLAQTCTDTRSGCQ